MFKFLAALFSKLSNWFTKAIKSGKDFLKAEIPAAIGVVDMIKQFVESPATPLLTKLIPGNIDDAIAEKLRATLPQVLMQLHLVQDIANLKTNDEIIQAVVARLREIPKADRKGKYLDLASMLSTYLTDGKLSWAEIVSLIQSTYETQNPK